MPSVSRAWDVVGSAASITVNVAVAQPTAAGRVIAAWPSFALIGAYELLMRQVRHGATGRSRQHTKRMSQMFWSGDGARESYGRLPPMQVLGNGRSAVIVHAGTFSGRRGSGH